MTKKMKFLRLVRYLLIKSKRHLEKIDRILNKRLKLYLNLSANFPHRLRFTTYGEIGKESLFVQWAINRLMQRYEDMKSGTGNSKHANNDY